MGSLSVTKTVENFPKERTLISARFQIKESRILALQGSSE